MILSMKEQLYIFLCALAFGAADFFIYDIIRILRLVFKHSFNLLQAQDAVFWLISAVFFYKLLIRLNNGEVRFYIIMGYFAGAYLYHVSFSKAIMAAAKDTVKALKKAMSYVLCILLAPFRLCAATLYVPVKFVYFSAKKLLLLCGKCAKIKILSMSKALHAKRKPVRAFESKKRKTHKQNKKK